MEIIDRGEDSADGPVQVAYALTREEAGIIHGLLREAGIRSLTRSRQILVGPRDAAEARRVLGETMVEEEVDETAAAEAPVAEEAPVIEAPTVEIAADIPEPVNARYLAAGSKRGLLRRRSARPKE